MKKEQAASGKKPILSEGDRNALFAVLVVMAIGVASYALLFSAPADPEADGSEFYARLTASDTAGFLFDVRGANDAQASAIYQCGVDMISKGRFAGKALVNIGCSEEGCLATNTAANGSSKLTYDQALKKFTATPYILIKSGEPSYKFYQRHMEIAIGKNMTQNSTCDIEATKSG